MTNLATNINESCTNFLTLKISLRNVPDIFEQTLFDLLCKRIGSGMTGANKNDLCIVWKNFYLRQGKNGNSRVVLIDWRVETK